MSSSFTPGVVADKSRVLQAKAEPAVTTVTPVTTVTAVTAPVITPNKPNLRSSLFDKGVVEARVPRFLGNVANMLGLSKKPAQEPQKEVKF